MGRAKKYATDAERQAAYRSRLGAATVVVDRVGLDGLHQRLEALHSGIESAARRGDSLAIRCRAGSIDTMLDRLIEYFGG
jgi:hypothetical protein